MKEEWLFSGAMVPVDMETTTALVAEIKRLIDVVGGMALAQPEQEPVAYCYVQKGTSVDILTFDDAPDDAVDGTIFPLYTTPPAAQPEQEPDELTIAYMSGLYHGKKKRPWVGLTDAEIQTIHDTYYRRMGPQEFAKAIESKLKDKNT